MIYDKLENIETYEGIAPRVMAGLKALRDTDFSKIENGRYELDGDKLYMNVSMAEEREHNDRPEAHRKYADIQYVIEGREDIGVGFVDDMEKEVEANPQSDIWFYQGETTKIRLEGSRFVVLFPQDAHAPCIAVNGEKTVRKAVVKVLL